ncbi:MAG TPA: tyrosine-protein phosphatase [Candidatus Acidoferrum sp.]|nr:tyrosine-protein phosphatase [Candidatus Acidoferrum sp.]
MTRRQTLLQAYNFRDLGGFPAKGGVTRFGRVWRTDLLGMLPDADIETVKAAGIGTVIDLRSADELERVPPSFENVPGIDYVNIPLLGDAPLGDALDECVRTADSFEASLTVLYKTMADRAPRRFAQVFEALAKGLAKGGVAFYCTAGKDRTGMIAALLLLACGVARADVVANYRITAAYLRPKIAHLTADSPLRPRSLMRSDPGTIEAFLDYLDEKHGGALNFLKSAGLAPEVLTALREELVEPYDEEGRTVTPLRRLPLKSVYNFRDLGGYPAKGGQTRYRKLWRSDFLGLLPPEDIEAIRAAGVATVIDLRSPDELARVKSDFADLAGIDYVNAPLLTMQLKKEFIPGDCYEESERELFYVTMPARAKDNIAAAVTAMTKALERGGVVFFCAAGKDRTGVLAALLLAVCGVGTSDIAADYEVSATLLAPKCAALPEGSPLIPKHPYQSLAETMEDFLARIGDVRAYLLEAGVAEKTLDDLTRLLVAP